MDEKTNKKKWDIAGKREKKGVIKKMKEENGKWIKGKTKIFNINLYA